MKTKDLIEAMASLLNLNVEDLAAGFAAFVNDFKAEATC